MRLRDAFRLVLGCLAPPVLSAVLFLTRPALGFAETAGSDSLAAAGSDSTHSDSLAAAPSIPEGISVTFTDGSAKQFARVEGVPRGFVRGIHGDGVEEFWPVHRISAIRQGKEDLTRTVIDRGKSVGVPVSTVHPSRPPALRGRPKPYRDGFPITQAGLLGQIGDNSAIGVFDFGGMKNVGTKYALGGTLSLEGGDDDVLAAIKPRIRRWITKELAIDAAPGIGFGNGQPAFIGELSFSAGDWVVLTGQMEVTQVETMNLSYSPGSFEGFLAPGHESSTQWYGGLKLGGEAGLGVVVVSMALVVILTLPGGRSY